MIVRSLLIIAAIAVFNVATTLAAPATGCNKLNFLGSYTRQSTNVDVIRDGTVIHNYIYQLTLQSDGIATQSWTGFTDLIMNFGTGTPWTGSWACRPDGKLVVTLITGSFGAIPTDTHPNAPLNDVELVSHSRTTYLFSVNDVNTLTRIQARARIYGPDEDPTNPALGSLGGINSTPITYSRLIASDADLLVP